MCGNRRTAVRGMLEPNAAPNCCGSSVQGCCGLSRFKSFFAWLCASMGLLMEPNWFSLCIHGASPTAKCPPESDLVARLILFVSQQEAPVEVLGRSKFLFPTLPAPVASSCTQAFQPPYAQSLVPGQFHAGADRPKTSISTQCKYGGNPFQRRQISDQARRTASCVYLFINAEPACPGLMRCPANYLER